MGTHNNYHQIPSFYSPLSYDRIKMLINLFHFSRNLINHLCLVTRKPAFCICENKSADQLRGTAKLISVFVFTT